MNKSPSLLLGLVLISVLLLQTRSEDAGNKTIRLFITENKLGKDLSKFSIDNVWYGNHEKLNISFVLNESPTLISTHVCTVCDPKSGGRILSDKPKKSPEANKTSNPKKKPRSASGEAGRKANGTDRNSGLAAASNVTNGSGKENGAQKASGNSPKLKEANSKSNEPQGATLNASKAAPNASEAAPKASEAAPKASEAAPKASEAAPDAHSEATPATRANGSDAALKADEVLNKTTQNSERGGSDAKTEQTNVEIEKSKGGDKQTPSKNKTTSNSGSKSKKKNKNVTSTANNESKSGEGNETSITKSEANPDKKSEGAPSQQASKEAVSANNKNNSLQSAPVSENTKSPDESLGTSKMEVKGEASTETNNSTNAQKNTTSNESAEAGKNPKGSADEPSKKKAKSGTNKTTNKTKKSKSADKAGPTSKTAKEGASSSDEETKPDKAKEEETKKGAGEKEASSANENKKENVNAALTNDAKKSNTTAPSRQVKSEISGAEDIASANKSEGTGKNNSSATAASDGKQQKKKGKDGKCLPTCRFIFSCKAPYCEYKINTPSRSVVSTSLEIKNSLKNKTELSWEFIYEERKLNKSQDAVLNSTLETRLGLSMDNSKDNYNFVRQLFVNKLISDMTFSFSLRTDTYIEPQILLGGRLTSPSAGNFTVVKASLPESKKIGVEVSALGFGTVQPDLEKPVTGLLSIEKERLLLPQGALDSVKDTLKKNYLQCKIDIDELSCKFGPKYMNSSEEKLMPYLSIAVDGEKEIKLKNFFKDVSINRDNMLELCSKSFCKTNIGLSLDKFIYMGTSLLRDYLWSFNIKTQKIQYAELNVLAPPHEVEVDDLEDPTKAGMSETKKNLLKAALFFSIVCAGACLAKLGHNYLKRNIERVLVQTASEESQPVKGFKWAWSSIRKGREKNDQSLHESSITQETFPDDDGLNRTEVYREKAKIFDKQDRQEEDSL